MVEYLVSVEYEDGVIISQDWFSTEDEALIAWGALDSFETPWLDVPGSLFKNLSVFDHDTGEFVETLRYAELEKEGVF